MIIDSNLLDDLTAQAKSSPRLRTNLDLRNSQDDTSQRMLNAIEPGSVVPVHRHKDTSETVVVLRGSVVEEYYDDQGNVIESITLAPMVCALNIPAGQWHSLKSMESGTVILEIKDGAYAPIQEDDILKLR